MPAERVMRFDRGVDADRFTPSRRTRPSPGAEERIEVLYAGRITREKGFDLLADAFLAAASRDPRLHLVLVGDGPERLLAGEVQRAAAEAA